MARSAGSPSLRRSLRFPIAAILVLVSLLLGPPYCCIPAAAAAAPLPPNTIASLAETSGLTQLSLALNTVDGYLLNAVTNSSTAVTVFAPTDAVCTGGGGACWGLSALQLRYLAVTGAVRRYLEVPGGAWRCAWRPQVWSVRRYQCTGKRVWAA